MYCFLPEIRWLEKLFLRISGLYCGSQSACKQKQSAAGARKVSFLISFSRPPRPGSGMKRLRMSDSSGHGGNLKRAQVMEGKRSKPKAMLALYCFGCAYLDLEV